MCTQRHPISPVSNANSLGPAQAACIPHRKALASCLLQFRLLMQPPGGDGYSSSTPVPATYLGAQHGTPSSCFHPGPALPVGERAEEKNFLFLPARFPVWTLRGSGGGGQPPVLYTAPEQVCCMFKIENLHCRWRASQRFSMA